MIEPTWKVQKVSKTRYSFLNSKERLVAYYDTGEMLGSITCDDDDKLIVCIAHYNDDSDFVMRKMPEKFATADEAKASVFSFVNNPDNVKFLKRT